MDLAEFKQKFETVKAKGFIKSHRKGDTGVGHTLEQELGLTENCISGPDLGKYELKAARRGAGGKQTFFNKEGDWVVSQRDYLKTYGFPHTEHIGETSGQCTVTKNVNKRGLSIVTTDDYCAVAHGDTIIVKWDWETLIDQYEIKFPACIKVIADVEIRDGVEYFHYNEANFYVNGDKNKIRTAIENGHMIIDLRLYTNGIQKNGKVRLRNRGTSLRMNHNKMEELFIKEEF